MQNRSKNFSDYGSSAESIVDQRADRPSREFRADGRQLQQAIDELDSESAEIFTMLSRGSPQTTIAERLSVSPATISRRYRDGIRRIRNKFDQNQD